MGKASRLKRERRERIAQGLEPIPAKVLSNPIARTAVKVASREGVIKELSKGTVSDQTQRLNTLVGQGALPGGKLRKEIMRNASKEMDKAIKKYQKQGKAITVDSLLVEVRSEPGFLSMCNGVGIDYSWFEDVARERMTALGVK
jgi:hypothetical protein